MLRSRATTRLGWAVWIALMVSSSGATCYPSLVCQLPPDPTLSDVLSAVDGNASLVQSLLVRDAQISGRAQGRLIPSLKARIALEKPRRFRLIADMPLAGGDAADLGSNDEEFWFWLSQNQPPDLFYIRHDDYAQAAGQLPLPFDPYWVIEALGVSPLGEAVTFDGAAASIPGRLQLRSTRTSPQGDLVTKLVLVDRCTGWVREQYLYDAHGALVASAVASRHQRDPSFGAVVPRRIQLEWPGQHLALEIQLKDVQVNEDLRGSAALWQKPLRQGVPQRNLFDLVHPAAPPGMPQEQVPRPSLDGIEPVKPENFEDRTAPSYRRPLPRR